MRLEKEKVKKFFSLIPWSTSYSIIPFCKTASLLDFKVLNTYSEEPRANEFAGVLLEKGFEDVKALQGQGEGTKFIIGYAFKDDPRFYFATEEVVGSLQFDIGRGSFIPFEVDAKANNTRPNKIAKKVFVSFERWDNLKLVKS